MFLRVFLFLFFTSAIAYGHNAVILGQVKDQSTGLPVPGASISVSGKGTLSNEHGQYVLAQVSAGTHEVLVSAVGYQSLRQKVTLEHDETVRLNFNLMEASISLEEVKINAYKPHEISVISQLDLQMRPIQNSQEVLRFVPGLLMGQHAGGGKAEQIFLRGFDIDHGTDILLSADGMPVNMVSHAHGQGYADLHFLIPELIDQVTFKKGMYSADKGNFSTAGWVDFKTKTSLDRNMAKIEVGQFNTYRGLAALNLLKKEKESAFVAGEYQYSDAYFDDPQKFNRLNVMGKYHKHWGNTDMVISASTFWSRWNHSGQIPQRAVDAGTIGFFGSIDPTEGGETGRTNVNATFSTHTAKNHLLKNQVFYGNYDFLLYSNFTFFLEDPEFGDQIKQKERRHLFGYNGSYQFTHGRGGELTLGAQYRQDLTRDTELSHTYQKTQILNAMMLGNIREANLSLYTQEDVALNQHWKLNMGLRYDIFFNRYRNALGAGGKASAGILLPKLNVYYTANERYQFYLNAGKGFHSNDTRVAVPQNGREVLPAAYGVDLGINAKPSSRLFLNAAYWYLHMDQEFVYVGDGGIVEPSGKSLRQGLDLSLRYQLADGLFFDSDLNWTKPRAIDEAKGDDFIPLAPIFTSMGGLTYKRKSGINGSIRYRYVADRPANEDNSIVADGYFINDLQLNYTQKTYQLGLGVQNLWNTRWKETQFNTLSRLKSEMAPVEEIHFTPGTPFFAKLSLTLYF
jgi:hypothetical protein